MASGESVRGAMAEEMVRAAPEAHVANMRKAKRKGKIFIDYFRNDYTATAIADYSVGPGRAPCCRPTRLERAEEPNLPASSR